MRGRSFMSFVAGSVLVGSVLAGCGSSLRCEERTLPDAEPSYSATVVGLVVVPTRAALRGGSDDERADFERFAVEMREACEASPVEARCALAGLRAELIAIPTATSTTVYTDIDGALDASLDAAHAGFSADARDCAGRSESACDAWLVARAFERALCDLRGGD